MNFGVANESGTTSKAWRDIWGCGQGIKPIQAVQPTADCVQQLADEYTAAIAQLKQVVP